ncbi:MAG TPA: M56 family metallopeptidase, partial [Pirellulales bacterium]|nr:M56 family metallopeptidase [Pirellulales bacterium]
MTSLLPFAWPFSHSVVERLGWVLVHSLWQFGLVALLARVTLRALRQSSAAARYAVLVAAMAVSVAAPAATWVLQPGNAPELSLSQGAPTPGDKSNLAADRPADASPLAGNPVLVGDTAVEGPGRGVAESRPAVLRSSGADFQPAPAWSQRARTALRPWLAWIVTGWSLGVVICSLRPLVGWATLRRLRRVGISPASDEVLAAMRRVSARLGLRRAVRVVQSTLAQVPVVVGYLRPAILLPASLVTSIPTAQLEAILAHELAHVQRHDFVVNLLQTLVETLFFYHPSVWWLSRQIRHEREHCCDDRVVLALGNRVEYGRALLAIEAHHTVAAGAGGRPLLLALGAADGSLLSRVRRIVGVGMDRAGPQATAARLSDRWPALCLGAACTLLASMAVLIGMAAADPTKSPPPKPDDLRGLDLSNVAVRGSREAYRSTPDLYVPDRTDPESWNHPKNVFQMPLAKHTWLQYPAGSGHFYIEHRPDGTPQSEQLYGPIEGDPFELLKLDDLFREQLEPGAASGDPRYRLRLMFATGEPGLIRRAARLIEPELPRKWSRDDAGMFRRIESLEIVRAALRRDAAAWGRVELRDVAAQLHRQVAAAEAAIDELNDAVPDDQYQSATYLQPKIAATIPGELWGRPVDGLRLALVPRDWTPGMDWNELPRDTPLPAAVAVEPGRELQYQLVVENVSDRDIKLCGYIIGEEIDRSPEILDGNGNQVEIRHLHTTIPHFRSFWRLKPGERQLLSMPAVHFDPPQDDAAKQGLGYFVKTAPGDYSLRCGIRLGQYDNTRHRHVPGQSEWIGQLTSGTQKITVADPTAAVDAEARAEVDELPLQKVAGPALVLPDRVN